MSNRQKQANQASAKALSPVWSVQNLSKLGVRVYFCPPVALTSPCQLSSLELSNSKWRTIVAGPQPSQGRALLAEQSRFYLFRTDTLRGVFKGARVELGLNLARSSCRESLGERCPQHPACVSQGGVSCRTNGKRGPRGAPVAQAVSLRSPPNVTSRHGAS